MAPMPLSLLALLALLAPEVSSTLQHRSIIRSGSEGTHDRTSMKVLADGEATQLELDGSGSSDEVNQARESMCDIDFPLGIENGCSCQSAGADEPHHTIILQKALCIEAASRHGMDTREPFAIEDAWFDYHPKGCFKDVCRHDSTKDCYFFNGVEPVPRKCPGTNSTGFVDLHPTVALGTPVCQRARYINGTTHTATHSHGGCPTGYGVIFHELKCTEAGTCLGDSLAKDFRITAHNESEHNVYPNGCFFSEKLDLIEYNNPEANGGAEPTEPGRNGGTQICQVSSDMNATEHAESQSISQNHGPKPT
jgi:hypothetical protein